jgi:hypothetical protein
MPGSKSNITPEKKKAGRKKEEKKEPKECKDTSIDPAE